MEVMTSSQLRLVLEEKFTVGAYIIIEDLEHQPSPTLYQLLVGLKQQSFPDNFRFVFANFNPVSIATLDHIVATLNYIDIPEFFVTVLSNQDDVVGYFADSGIDSQLLDISVEHKIQHQSTPLFNTKNQMCAHAWTGFWVNSDGTATPCCDYKGKIKKTNGENFNVQTDSFDDIVASPYMDQLRDKFRQGIKPVECNTCWDRAKSNADNRIGLTPYKLKNVYGNIDWAGGGKVDWIGGHIGNLCNLGCVICSASYSTTIATEDIQNSNLKDKKQHPSYQLLKDNRWPSNSDIFWQKLKSQLPGVRNFEFLGGEPFLLQENLDFLQHLIDHNYCQNSIVQFSTNGTQFPDVCQSLYRFQRAEITFSIDNVGAKFEYERYRANWVNVKDNIAKFINQRSQNSSIKLNACIAVNVQNVYDLPETIAELNNIGIDTYYISIVEGPKQLSITQLTDEAKQLVLKKLVDCNNDKFKVVIDIIHNSKWSDGVDFCNFIRHKDQIRNTNFLNSHPKIGKAMGYIP
jgi:MoaA/NifB/PqqE/SkfB family radical SAM enzyme